MFPELNPHSNVAMKSKYMAIWSLCLPTMHRQSIPRDYKAYTHHHILQGKTFSYVHQNQKERNGTKTKDKTLSSHFPP
jgi:hypothetical protein